MVIHNLLRRGYTEAHLASETMRTLQVLDREEIYIEQTAVGANKIL